MNANRLRIALPTQLAAGVLEVANQFLFLRVHRDRRLTGGDRCLHRVIDVRELGIAIRMAGPFARLAVGLAAIFQLTQQVRHHPLTGPEPLCGQRLDQVTQAPADPAQWRRGITADGVLNQRLQRRWQARLMLNGALAPTTRTAHPLADVIASGLQLADATIDRAARQPGRCCGRHHPAIALCHSFVGGKEPTAALVEKLLHLLPALAYLVDVDHALTLASWSRVAPSKFPILFLRS